MNVYPINPQTHEKQYDGAGWAMAAIANDSVVAIRYLHQIDDDLGGTLDEYADAGLKPNALINAWMQTPSAGEVVRELQALGLVSIGMCSCGEFVEM